MNFSPSLDPLVIIGSNSPVLLWQLKTEPKISLNSATPILGIGSKSISYLAKNRTLYLIQREILAEPKAKPIFLRDET